MKKRDQRKFNVYERSAGPDRRGELPTRGTDHELRQRFQERSAKRKVMETQDSAPAGRADDA